VDVLQILRRQWVIFAHDVLWVPVTIALAYLLRFNLILPERRYLESALVLLAFAVPIHAATFWLFGCYRGVWRFASVPDFVRILKAVCLGALATVLGVFLLTRLQGIPRSVLVLYPILLVTGVMGTRILNRIIKEHALLFRVAPTRVNALIVGAGRGGEMLVRDLLRHGPFQPVAFVDDDPSKQGQDIHGITVRGTLNDISIIIRSLDVRAVLIALPSASRSVMNRVVSICADADVICRTLPALSELVDGRVEVSRLRPVTVEDLLGRDPVILDRESVKVFLRGKRVLITGGGGSIGSELCRQVAKQNPGLLIILDSCEYNLYRIDQEISTVSPGLLFNTLLSDVRDERAIDALFIKFKPQVVFHAAAYKHVPLVEDNVIEGIRNNVFGTQIVADTAKRHGVETFVLISTDKTVNPTNVMGTTKRVAELYCQMLNESSSTHFITTRFGNVLGSAGSVVPLFKHQIESGGPVTVTHPEITRFFMTIPEAASLILQASAIGKGGEIFVLDMGEPIRIRDLAEKLIQLSGLQPDRDIKITYIGLRPGEKLHEELFYSHETLRTTIHPKLMLAGCHDTDISSLSNDLEQRRNAVNTADQEQALNVLRSMVPEFQHDISSKEENKRPLRPSLQVVK
jgi:FlaA1/EpsC-like NDP-sugar epimerase